MADIKMRRMLVMDRDKRLAAIVSLAGLATKADATHAGEALGGISQPR
jgi:hypothetical protein